MTHQCPELPRVHVYYDREMPLDQCGAFEVHLSACPACQAELAGLEPLGLRLRQGRRPVPPLDLAAQIKRRIVREPYRAMLRFAWGLTGAAAAIVVVCLVQLNWVDNSSAASGPPAAWEILAVRSGPDAGASEEMDLATWIAQDLAGEAADSVRRKQEAATP
ncbi:MAG: zf-HC2 domain-containing protein [Phycisphaeraceae bacterium]